MVLVTIEGGEGSGKGTLLKKLAEFLEKEGYEVETAREPGSVDIAEEIRKVIQKPGRGVNKYTELFLYEAARAQFTEEFLKPMLEERDIVILDRFYDSTTAYQGYGRELDIPVIMQLNTLAAQGVVPDLTFILDLPPQVGLERCEKSEFGREGDRMEQEDILFHNRIREGYLEMAEQDPRFRVIDAEKNDANDVFEIAREHISELLNKNK